MKIHNKIILFLTIIALFTASGSAILFFTQVEPILLKRARDQLESVVVLKEQELNRFMKMEINVIEDMAGTDVIREYLDRSGEIENKSKVQILEWLDHKLKHTEFAEIFVLTSAGNVELSSKSGQMAKIKQSQAYFIEGKKATFVQAFYYDVTLQGLAVTISSPIKDKKGNLLGVLVGRVDLFQIGAIMAERTGLGMSGETYLINKFNFVVSELRKEPEAVLKTAVYTDAVKDCLFGNEGFSFHNDYVGDEVLGFYKWIPEQEVCLVASIERQEAMRSITQFRNIVILNSLGIVVLVVIFGFVFSKRISKSIIKLRDAALEIKKGKLGVRIEIKSKDEIGQLAVVFNEMAAHLEEYAEGLEAKVEGRTKELQDKMEELRKFHKLVVDRELKMIELKKEIAKLKKNS